MKYVQTRQSLSANLANILTTGFKASPILLAGACTQTPDTELQESALSEVTPETPFESNIPNMESVLKTEFSRQWACDYEELMQRKPSELQPVSISATKFNTFNPVPSTAPVNISDGLLEAYLRFPISLNELSMCYGRSAVSGIGETFRDCQYAFFFDENKRIDIEDYDAFTQNVVKAANELGCSDVSSLSVNEAIMLSGRIVAEAMSYNQDMLVTMSDAGEIIIPDEARRVDLMPEDEMFNEGSGVCRNYAAINSAVFEVLKDHNPGLMNTYMRQFWPQRIDHMLGLPHGWNMVTNMSEDNNGLNIQMTFVDPTWLDTRSQTVDSSGEVENVSAEELYNAFDEGHFGAGALLGYDFITNLLEELGADQRIYFRRFATTEEAKDGFNAEAVRNCIDVCDRAVDLIAANKDVEFASTLYCNSIDRIALSLTGLPTVRFLMTHGLEDYDLNPEYDQLVSELEQLYERTLNDVPLLVGGIIIPSDVFWKNEETDQFAFGVEYRSFPDLIDVLKNKQSFKSENRPWSEYEELRRD